MILKLLASAVAIEVLVHDIEGGSSLVLHSHVVFNFSLHNSDLLLLVKL
jgi:hypothetical protein